MSAQAGTPALLSLAGAAWRHVRAPSEAIAMSFTAADVAQWCNGRIEGSAQRLFTGMNFLDQADGSTLTFVGHSRYGRKLGEHPAAGALCTEGIEVKHRSDQTIIWVKDADLATAQVLGKLAPPAPLPDIGIHPSAIVSPQAVLGREVRIGPLVVVEANATIGDRCVLMAHNFIGRGSTLGEDCTLWPNAVVRERCSLGKRVILHCGCVIGADGFGYRFAGTEHIKIPQIGRVTIGDDCELGANTTVDRGKFGDTVIGDGSKLDNLVQIGHNVALGRGTVLVAHVAVGGSVKAGDYLVMGGGSVIADHVTLGPGTRVAGFSAVTGDAPAGSELVGTPARPAKEYFAELRGLHHLPKSALKLRELEQRISTLESTSKND